MEPAKAAGHRENAGADDDIDEARRQAPSSHSADETRIAFDFVHCRL